MDQEKNNTKAKENGLSVRGIRGAIALQENDRKSILEAAQLLLEKITSENRICPDQVISVFFTTTKDINAEFPAAALRKMGWFFVPSLCAHEMDVPGGMKSVIRILVHAYSAKTHKEIKHQYLGKASVLRPDWTGGKDDHRNEA